MKLPTRISLKALLSWLAGLALLGAAGAGLFIWLGAYNVSALEQHTKPFFWLADMARLRAVAVRAEDIEVPPLDGPGWPEAGFGLYHRHCEQCHGAPGVAPEPFALGMDPVPSAIVGIAHKRRDFPEEMYWVIANGIRMTGMPAWRYRFTETQIWQLVAFLQAMPLMTSADYRELLVAYQEDPARFTDPAAAQTQAEPYVEDQLASGPVDRGREAIQQYGCSSCHLIPGITSAENHVGPPLAGMADRSFIAGILPNNRENMIRWLQAPQDIAPRSLMPDLGVEEDDARHIAAYLSTLGEGRRQGLFGPPERDERENVLEGPGDQ